MKYPAPKKKFVPYKKENKLPPLNKPINPDEVLDRIIKLCDEAKNNKNG